MSKTILYRLIDKYIGASFCLIIGFFKKFKKKDLIEVKSILLVKPWAIGDSVVTLPLIKLLRENYPDAKIDIVARKQNLQVYTLNKNLNNTINFDLNKLKLATCFKKYDLGIDLDPYLKISSLITWYCSKYSLGFGNQLRSLIHDKTTPFSHDQHMVDNYLDFLRILGKDCSVQNLEPIIVSEDDRVIVENFLKNYGIKKEDLLIGICAGSGESAKTRVWDEKNFAKLADELKEKSGANVIFVGGNDEVESFEKIKTFMKTEPINAVKKFSLKQSTALIERCNVFISNDTGPMHIAAAQGVKTIGLFGPNTPVLWKPYGERNIAIYKNVSCSPCIKNDEGVFPDCLRKDDLYLCMRLITVDDIVRAVDKCLKKK